MIEEEKRDDDVIDPEDPEVELEDEDADADFDPDADVIPEEEESASDVTAFGFAPAFIPEAELEDESLDESEEEESSVLEEPQPEETAQYRITAYGASIYDAQGLMSRMCPIGAVEELPLSVGDTFVDQGVAEKVQ